MKIEVLFPELCNLFGDLFNVKYLEACLPQAERVDTPLAGEPLFLTEAPALIYMGPMSERTQEKVIQKLLPCRARLKELIEGGTAFLLTGNAPEVFGVLIDNEDGSQIHGLDLLPLAARRDMMHRHNSVFLGEWEGQEVIGFKSQFTMAQALPGAEPLFWVKKGVGLNKKLNFEGLRDHNLFATYLLGPVLVLNPGFAKSVLAAMGAQGTELAYGEAAGEAYSQRVKDFHEKLM